MDSTTQRPEDADAEIDARADGNTNTSGKTQAHRETSEAPEASNALAPYRSLSPSLVLDALDAVGLYGDGRLIQLNSYENRVFQVMLEDSRVVVTKFYRPARWSDAQILEEHEFATELAENEIPVAASLQLQLDASSRHATDTHLLGATLAQIDTPTGPYRFSVAERLAGRAPELEDPATLEWIGRFIGRMHAVGARGHFKHRETLDLATFGTRNRDWLIEHDLVTPDVSGEWRRVTEAALMAVGEAFDAVGAKSIRLHGDCHPGNMLWTERGPHFVDLDDAVMGPATQDLWMLLSGDRAAKTRQLGSVLAGYEGFMDFDWRTLRLVEPLRTLRILHHSAWIARRWDDPAFPVAFPWFASPKYWAEQTTRLREQIEAMQEPALGSPG
jgi:Ser/Thr protein kinase RdoA (MazF antagonist)